MKTIALAIILGMLLISLANAAPEIDIVNPVNNSKIGTDFVFLKVLTSEPSVCYYSLCMFFERNGSGGGGCSGEGEMSVTGDKVHTQLIDGLHNTTNNQEIRERYEIRVRCQNYNGEESRKEATFYVNIIGIRTLFFR